MTTLDDMVLVPRPRRVVPTGGWVDDPAPATGDPAQRHPRTASPTTASGGDARGLRAAPAAGLPAQGFRLTISEGHGIHVEHADDAGLRYATQLLEQIRGQSPEGRLPTVHVEDHPDFPTRGFMLDVSRDRVPTRATLERLVGLAALARLNQLQLYVEHTFAYRDHPEVWASASPLTPDDLAWLDDLCTGHGIELVANQNCFGHMGRWLAHDRHRPRAECPDGWEPIPGLRLPPSVLAPTADNAAFSLALLRELLDHVRSRSVHIGGDEPFELGHGASRAEVEARGLGAVYVEHLRRLADPLLAEGRQVQVWADVLRRHPDRARTLPDGIVPVAWCYEAPPPDGRPLDLPEAVVQVMATFGTDPDAFSGFAPQVAPLAQAGVPFWVAPGTSSWCSLVGRSDNSRANLLDAALVGRAHGGRGYLITDWGDGGHHQPPSVSFGPLVLGGALAWGADANRDLDLGAVLSRHVFGDPTGRLAAALDTLGRQWARTGQRALNGSPLSAALLSGVVHLVLDPPDRDRVRDVVETIEEARADVAAARPTSTDAADVVAEVDQAARLARHGAWRLLGSDGPGPDRVGADMVELVEGQAATWLARARPGGLADSLARLDADLATTVRIPDGA